jgi:hypothetical protein
MRLACWTLLLGLLLGSPAALLAQQQLAERLVTRRATVAPASVEWFVQSLELADAQSQVDLEVAVATATPRPSKRRATARPAHERRRQRSSGGW